MKNVRVKITAIEDGNKVEDNVYFSEAELEMLAVVRYKTANKDSVIKIENCRVVFPHETED